MFYLGDWDKQKIVDYYIEHNDVRKVVLVYNKKLKTDYTFSLPHKEVEWHESIMYKFYYDLLQYIDKYTLIIIDECLVNQQRYALEYNCINNFVNQTPQRIVFNYLPFIDKEDDFMILLDFYNKTVYKNEPFRWEYFKQTKVQINPVHLKFNFIDCEIDEKDREKYIKKRNELFDNIGLKDPDTIPRNLMITAGDCKKKYIKDDGKYLARNQRFKKKNITLYSGNEVGTIIDFPSKRIELTNLLALTKETEIDVLTSDLSIDKYMKKDYEDYVKRLENFYDKASIFEG